MNPSANKHANGSASRFLKPELLARLGTLELVARTVVDGVLTGLHRSPDFGFSQEFAEYRAYNEGDDLRFVDWNVYARADRMYVKRFRGETNTSVNLLLDMSASMAFGEPISKLDQARFLVASLAYLTRKQHDALSITIFDDVIREHTAPSARPDSLMKVLGLLETTEIGNATDVVEVVKGLQATLPKRGLLVLVSDLYTQPADLQSALQHLVHVGHDIAVFHILDPDEIDPPYKKIAALKSLESGNTVIVDPQYLHTDYKTVFSEHCKLLESSCIKAGADYIQVKTSDPLDNAIVNYLHFRERQAR
jgi:uncharacterized protein (DUF58 family)